MTKPKTTPHLKRGPKPKLKAAAMPKREPGRPEMELRLHPDRYSLARFDVAALWLKGNLYKGERMGAAMVRAMGAVKHGEEVADLRKAAERLRSMATQYRKPADMKWRRAIAKAVGQIMLAAAAGTDPEPERMGLVLEYAASVGEEDWARRELLPMAWMKPTGTLLDLAERERLQSLAFVIAMVGWASDVLSWKRQIGHPGQIEHPEIAGNFSPTFS